MKKLICSMILAAAWLSRCMECPAQSWLTNQPMSLSSAPVQMGPNQTVLLTLSNQVPVMVMTSVTSGVVLNTAFENLGGGPIFYTWGSTNGWHYLPAGPGAIINIGAATPIYDPLWLMLASSTGTVVNVRRDFRKESGWPR